MHAELKRLGEELLIACYKNDWQEVVTLAENGEWTGAERHREVMFC